MELSAATANIHLRARKEDKALIERAANLKGVNRSQFILAAGLKEAKSYLLDQTTIYADAKAFSDILDWMETEPTATEQAGMKRLLETEIISNDE